jgi:transmembrane sensor
MSGAGLPRHENGRATVASPVDTLRQVAAHWHDRMRREPVPERISAAFSRWLDKEPAHRICYEEVDRAWRMAQASEHDPRVLALRHETALRLTRRSSRRARWSTWVAAASILVVLGALGVASRTAIFDAFDSWRTAQTRVYRTGIGERLAITLEDGSQVTLNTDSILRNVFDSRERRVVLERGQVLFEVAKDPARAFVVETVQRRFVAVGTAFDVRVDGQRVQVTMLEGTVRVERTRSGADQASERLRLSSPAMAAGSPDVGSDSAGPVATITAGEQLSVVDERQDRIQVAEPDRVTSWRRGQLIFENSRLADAVAEINRYSSTRITLADEALGELRISGAFATGRPAVFVEAMTAYFPIDGTHVDDQTLLLSARKGAAASQ